MVIVMDLNFSFLLIVIGTWWTYCFMLSVPNSINAVVCIYVYNRSLPKILRNMSLQLCIQLSSPESCSFLSRISLADIDLVPVPVTGEEWGLKS